MLARSYPAIFAPAIFQLDIYIPRHVLPSRLRLFSPFRPRHPPTPWHGGPMSSNFSPQNMARNLSGKQCVSALHIRTFTHGPECRKQRGTSTNLAGDIHKLSDLLSPQSMLSEELVVQTEILVTHIAMTLQKESNSLLFLDQETTTTLILCLQMVRNTSTLYTPANPDLTLHSPAPRRIKSRLPSIRLRSPARPASSPCQNLPRHRVPPSHPLPQRHQVRQLPQCCWGKLRGHLPRGL